MNAVMKYRHCLFSLSAVFMLLPLFTLFSCNKSTLHFQGGTYQGEVKHDLPEGYGIFKDNRYTYEGQWQNGSPNGFGIAQNTDSCYQGAFLNGLRQGQGRLTVRSLRIVYNGSWKHGLRQGKGSLSDSHGRIWEGIWKADTLTEGTVIDSSGIYSGTFNRHMLPQGYGTFQSALGNIHYEGHWQNGLYNGFGFELDQKHDLRCGWWRRGHFLGERMRYTSARVYGIDISHYQHGGRPSRHFRGYPIYWNKLRITHMGSNTKNSIGQVDYPVSFCYMKTTQGTSIHNPYYRKDAHEARKAGIYVGAYHFMSTASGIAQAKWFLRQSPILKVDLPPMLDVELTKNQITRMGGPEAMFREMLLWLHYVEHHTGKRPILYIGQHFVNSYMPVAPEQIRNYQVWIARYSEFRPYIKLLYWQLTPFGRVQGIRGDVDINVFNGSIEQFRTYVNTYCAPR
jgi:lysozyme